MNIQAVTGDSNSQISYELIDNPNNYFALDQTTGNLTIARQLDRVALAAPNNVLILTVRASAGIGNLFMRKKRNKIFFYSDESSNSTTTSTADVTVIVQQQADTTGPAR